MKNVRICQLRPSLARRHSQIFFRMAHRLDEQTLIRLPRNHNGTGHRPRGPDRAGGHPTGRPPRGIAHPASTSDRIQLEEELANTEGGFNLIGFLAGFLLAFLGVLLVFLLASNNKAMKRSAWLGLGVLLLLALLGIVL